MNSQLTPEGIPYPYLPEGKTIKCVPLTDVFMTEAARVRNEESTEMNHPTGAVGVRDGVIVARKANQAALGIKWLQRLHRQGLCIRRLLKIKTGTKYWMCPGCARHHHHAEYGVAEQFIDKGIAAGDVYLYGHWWCCKPCWDKMIEAGVRDVYLVEGAARQFKK